jgi:hypothetical protein
LLEIVPKLLSVASHLDTIKKSEEITNHSEYPANLDDSLGFAEITILRRNAW